MFIACYGCNGIFTDREHPACEDVILVLHMHATPDSPPPNEETSA